MTSAYISKSIVNELPYSDLQPLPQSLSLINPPLTIGIFASSVVVSDRIHVPATSLSEHELSQSSDPSNNNFANHVELSTQDRPWSECTYVIDLYSTEMFS